MNMELNKENRHEEAKPLAKRKKRKPLNKRVTRPSVTYGDDELLTVEGAPFWNASHQAQIKDIVSDGVVVSIAKNGGAIDVFVPNEELCFGVDRNVGQTINIYLEDAIAANSQTERPFLGSEIKAVELDLLVKADAARFKDEPVSAYVIGEIKGGYTLALFAESRDAAENGFGLRAFLPMGRSGLRRDQGLSQEEPQIFVKISEFDPVNGNIVVSRREHLAKERKKEESAFFEKISVGDQVSGTVTASMPYGVFVNLGPADGFLHISDISWDKKPKMKDLVPVGKEIHAQVIEVDKENRKIKLSIKTLNADPWQAIDKNYKPGSEVEGDIVAFADFGAFVRLKDGVEGLIHVGEIAWGRLKHPSQHFRIGDHVKALVLRVDKEARRISLSTKALELSPVERLSEQFPIGSVIKTKIESIHDFGLFVELDETSNGLVPRSEVSWIRSEDPLDKNFSVGQEIEVAVLGYDSVRQRVSCSIKRVNGDPWQKWKNDFRKGSQHKVKVIEVKRAGVVCALDGELTAFCPRSQLADGENDGKVNVKVGDEIEVVVTLLDLARHRVSISQKEAAEGETKRAYQSYLNEQNRGFGNTTLGDAFRIDKNKGRSKDHG